MDNLVETLRRARQADSVAVEALVVHFEPVVRAECNTCSLPTPDLSVSDLYQEAMVRIWTQLDKFKGSEQEEPCRLMFRQWLRTTTRNVVANLSERQRAARRIACTESQPAAAQNGDPNFAMAKSETPSQFVGGVEEAERVRAAIAQLDDAERTLVELCFFEEFTLKEVAETMQITYDQARTRFSRALNQLRFRLR